MRGIRIRDGKTTYREDLEAPGPKADEVLIAPILVGLCATDLALARGYMGFSGIPGHEFVGRALEGPLEGRRVVGDINAACGRCAVCTAGDPHHCPERDVLGILARPGVFAERTRLPGANLLEVPDAVSDEAAVFAEPLAAAYEVLEQVSFRGEERVLVAGDGRLGLLIAMVLAAEGLYVTVAGRHPERAALLGGSVRFATDLLEDPEREAGAFDLGVEATGNPSALAGLVAKVRPRGTIVLKTTTEKPVAFDLAPVVVNEITLLGSRCGPMPRALEALANARIDPTPLIAERLPLARAPEGFERAFQGGVLKILFDVAGES